MFHKIIQNIQKILSILLSHRLIIQISNHNMENNIMYLNMVKYMFNNIHNILYIVINHQH